MNDEVAKIASPRSVTVYRGIEVHTISDDHPNYDIVKSLAEHRVPNWDNIIDLMKPIRKIKTIGWGFTVENNSVFFNGEPVHNLVCERIVEAVGQRDSDVGHLVNFLRRLRMNPSQKSQRELYRFLEVNDLPVRPDGRFVAYKRIRDNYTDTYSGTVDNRPGCTIPRKRWDQVDDDSNRTCSNGYHVCGFGYLSHFWGERLISVLVDPADVVSVPVDYHDTKMRVTYYQPYKEMSLDLVQREDDVLRNNRAEWEGWAPTPDEGDEVVDEQQFWDGYLAAKRDILDLISEEV